MPSKPRHAEYEKQIRELEKALAEARKTEAALREREARQRFLLEYMTDTVWTLDMHMRPTYVSPSSTTVLGYTPEERLTQHLSEMVTPETYGRVMELFARELEREATPAVDSDRTISIEMEYIHKEGHTVWLENKIRAIRDADGRIVGIHGVSRDIDDRKRTEEALRSSEERFRLLSYLTTDIIYSCRTDADGVFSIEWLSGNVEKITGYSIDEIRGRCCWRSLVLAEDLPLFDRHVTGLIPGQAMSVDLRIRRKDGETAWVTSYAECKAENEPQGTKRLFGGLVDVTHRKQVEEILRRKEAELNHLIELLPIAVSIDISDKIVYANMAFAALFGAASTEEVLGVNLLQFIAPDMLDELKERRRIMKRSKQALPPLELNLRCLNGTIITVVSSPMPIDYQGQQAVLITMYDVTKRKRKEIELQKAYSLFELHNKTIDELQTQLKEQVIRDPLTGLFNRRYLEETLAREFARASRDGFPVSVIMIDIDHFRTINDLHGHEAGDFILRNLGKLLIEGIRATDIACRYSGEEFLLILPKASQEAAVTRAEQCRTGFEALRTVYGGQLLKATISLGIATYPSDGASTQEIILAADQAMSRAKACGRNRVILSGS